MRMTAETESSCGHGMVSSQSTFICTCKGLCGGGNLWNLDQWFPNEAPHLLSAASTRETLILPIYTVVYCMKFQVLKRCFFMLRSFYYIDPWYLSKDLQAIYKSKRTESKFSFCTYCVTFYTLLDLYLSLNFPICKVGLYVKDLRILSWVLFSLSLD